MNKRVSLGMLSAIAIAQASAVSLGNPDRIHLDSGISLNPRNKSNKNKDGRIKKQWYTVDSPEVKRMSVKKWGCDGCGCEVSVPQSYEPKGCCSGYECGCMGMCINPVFCRKCSIKIFGK